MLAVLLVAAALLLVPSAPARADVQDFTFASLDVDFTLTAADDGTSRLRVVETFVAEFPEYDQNRGMRRSIPDSYEGAPLNPHLVSVADESGAGRPVETESDDGYLIVTSAADSYVHGAQTYVFTYELENVTRYFSDTDADEFYWDVLGEEWAQPFGRVGMTLHVDPALAPALTGEQTCYAGYTGSTTQCEIAVAREEDGSATITASASNLLPYQSVTVAVGFAAGTFVPFNPSLFASVWGWLLLIASAGAVVAFVWAVTVRVRRLSDDPGRPTIIAEYTSPAVIDALESSVLLGRPNKGIPAEVLEQAVVGSIRIVEGEQRLFGGVKLQAELLDRSRADGDGRMLLDGLFGRDGAPGDVYEFGRSDTAFSTAAQAILKSAQRQLELTGLRRVVPSGVRLRPMLAVFGAAALVVLFAIFALVSWVSPAAPVLLLILAVLLATITGVILSRKPLTALGAEVRDHLAGLKVFIDWAEADRIQMLQSPAGAERAPVDVNDPRQMLMLYERLLPYAVVFGQEKQWAKHLAVLYGAAAPAWYIGTHGFDASAFSSGISTLSAASTSSSSSGGSSGGGSAGGGGGGGGGGGV
ncbi:hypothetical protein Microterr_23950 [Microbacterium terricola]|uniref:DUF2207 domain-containing protein n=2 Tax=Microbacterium terricola TaxID=344163 RepID=A0ABM8E1Q8_9MICO|nr:hypothetical protein Microterr_23950 [Microbacterium terricola]